jgi:DNA primase large subunit
MKMQEDISIYEAAKYPWSVLARSLLKELDISLAEVDKNPRVIQHAQQRLKDAIEGKSPQKKGSLSADAYVELTSFFIAKALVDAIGSMYLRRRWATVEAKSTEAFLVKESDARLAQIAAQEFNWQITTIGSRVAGRTFTHSLHFTNYLAAAAGFHEREWKLVNKRLNEGFVLLRKSEMVRVLRAAVEKLLIHDIKKVPADFPPNLQLVYEELDSIVRKRADRLKQEIEGEIVYEAFPPCIQALLSDMKQGKPLSHIARFAITAFLLNVGMDIDSIVELFMQAPDFREDLARYQIEHIAGKRGSTEYTPPSCAYMISVRLCVNPDQAEIRRHPLNYYRNRRKRLSKR